MSLLVVEGGGGGLGGSVAVLLVSGAGRDEYVSALARGTERVGRVAMLLFQLLMVLGLCEYIVLYGGGAELPLESEVGPARTGGGPVGVRREGARAEHRVVEEREVRGQQDLAGGGRAPTQVLRAQLPR